MLDLDEVSPIHHALCRDSATQNVAAGPTSFLHWSDFLDHFPAACRLLDRRSDWRRSDRTALALAKRRGSTVEEIDRVTFLA
jgi:hypothetical protein